MLVVRDFCVAETTHGTGLEFRPPPMGTTGGRKTMIQSLGRQRPRSGSAPRKFTDTFFPTQKEQLDRLTSAIEKIEMEFRQCVKLVTVVLAKISTVGHHPHCTCPCPMFHSNNWFAVHDLLVRIDFNHFYSRPPRRGEHIKVQ